MARPRENSAFAEATEPLPTVGAPYLLDFANKESNVHVRIAGVVVKHESEATLVRLTVQTDQHAKQHGFVSISSYPTTGELFGAYADCPGLDERMRFVFKDGGWTYTGRQPTQDEMSTGVLEYKWGFREVRRDLLD